MKEENGKAENAPPTVSVLGIPYFLGNIEEAVAHAQRAIEERRAFAVFTPGATVAACAAKDGALFSVLLSGDLILPDGCGVSLASRLAGERVPIRIAGIDFAEALLAAAQGYSCRVFLYGACAGVAERAAARLREKYPSLIFAAADGYGEDPWRRIAAYHPHVTCVCLGAGKQEAWIMRHKDEIGGVLIGLGGSFDVWSGDKRRAPRFLRRVGLEWAWRTACEPRRLPRLFPLPFYFIRCLFSRRWSKCQKNEEKKKSDGKM